jgi:hypothetical protein
LRLIRLALCSHILMMMRKDNPIAAIAMESASSLTALSKLDFWVTRWALLHTN